MTLHVSVFLVFQAFEENNTVVLLSHIFVALRASCVTNSTLHMKTHVLISTPILKINCNSSDLIVSNCCHRYINNTDGSRRQRVDFVFALETDEYLAFQIFYEGALWEITRQ